MTIEEYERELPPERVNFYLCHLILDDEEARPGPDLPPEEVEKNVAAHQSMVDDFDARMDRLAQEAEDNELAELDDAE